ncbi:rhodanese-like domain-containing protein [uncultured Roseibium sp.]|uniref:rhodanese-like domain-containing protein n=1 Tax=uncultured Roseibium sp. TaxID=1936171 RepID=UPI003216E928
MASPLIQGAVVQFSDQYAGDVESAQAYERLTKSKNTVLIDVRTRAEWNFVGVPDLSEIGKEVLLVEWQSFPPAPPVTEFAAGLSALLAQQGFDQETELYFLCRSGQRSQSAAIALTQAGYGKCFNVSGGFEGSLDQKNHRGTQSGWKAAGLPWVQS